MKKQTIPANVIRGGRTASYWSHEGDDVTVEAGQTLNISFFIASKGGGDTGIQIQFSPAVFPAVMRAMAMTDPRATLEAMHGAIEEAVAELQRESERSVKAAKKAAYGELLKRARDEHNKDVENGKMFYTFDWLLSQNLHLEDT